MHQQEPPPQHLFGLLALGSRVVIGAALGFVCAVAIIGVNSSGAAFSPQDALRHTVVAAWKTGGLLGAIYLPIASAWFLPKQNQAKMIAVAVAFAIISGVLGFSVMGPWAPASVAASFGFWIVIFAMDQHDQRSRSWRGRGSYLP